MLAVTTNFHLSGNNFEDVLIFPLPEPAFFENYILQKKLKGIFFFFALLITLLTFLWNIKSKITYLYVQKC